jgi:hypothetical protein
VKSGNTSEVTGETITDEQIHLVRKAMQGVPRKTSYHRAIISDCGPALDGSKACRESVASAYNKMSRGQVKGAPTP